MLHLTCHDIAKHSLHWKVVKVLESCGCEPSKIFERNRDIYADFLIRLQF